MQRIRIWPSLLVLLFSGACASNSVTPQEVAELKQQVINLQKTQGIQNNRIEELNNKILLLKDKIDNKEMNNGSSSEAPLPIPPAVTASENPIPVPVISAPAREKDGPEKLYEQALQDLKKPQLSFLEHTVDQMLKNYKDSPLTNNALFLLAKAEFDHGQFSQGATQFEKLYKTYPDGNKAVAALFQLGLCYKKMGHFNEAKEAFQNVITVYPGSAEASAAEKELAQGGVKQ